MRKAEEAVTPSVRRLLWAVLLVPAAFLASIVLFALTSGRGEPGVSRTIVAVTSQPAPTEAARPAPIPPPAAAPPMGRRPAPEDIVVFPHSSIVCLKLEDLREVVESGLRNEETKVNAMVSGEEDSPCFMVSPTKRLKVLSANYPDAASDLGTLEVVGKKVVRRRGGWVMSVGAEVVSARKTR